MSDNTGECKCCDKLADEIERLTREIKQADERGDAAMARAHQAERELAEAQLGFAPLLLPAPDALDVFAAFLERHPTADMRPVPNQWVLNERGIGEQAVNALERELAEARGLLRSVLKRNPLLHPTSRNEINAFLTAADQPTDG